MSVFFAFFHLKLTKQDVDEVGVGRVLLQLVGDGVVDAGGLLHHLAPLLVAATVGEDGDAATTQAGELLCGETAAAASCKPELVWMSAGHDEGGLLALDDADRGLTAQG